MSEHCIVSLDDKEQALTANTVIPSAAARRRPRRSCLLYGFWGGMGGRMSREKELCTVCPGGL
jgi:hypothetical protein